MNTGINHSNFFKQAKESQAETGETASDNSSPLVKSGVHKVAEA